MPTADTADSCSPTASSPPIDAPGRSSGQRSRHDIDDSGRDRRLHVHPGGAGQLRRARQRLSTWRCARRTLPPSMPGRSRRRDPFGINNSGQMVGVYVDAQGMLHAFPAGQTASSRPSTPADPRRGTAIVRHQRSRPARRRVRECQRKAPGVPARPRCLHDHQCSRRHGRQSAPRHQQPRRDRRRV